MKRFAVTSLTIATTLLALSGNAFSQDQPQNLSLMEGNAELSHALDTQSAMKGQVVTAKLTGKLETPEGLTLPRGTELIGHVDEVQASHDKSAATLALTFDKAHLKDGKEVAIKATLVDVAPANTPTELPKRIAADDSFDQEPGTLPGVSLHSAVQGDNSGTLTSKNKNIKLGGGTEMLIAIAPGSGVHDTAGGSY